MPVEFKPFSRLLKDVVDNRGRTCPTAEEGIPLIATNCIRNDLLYPAYEKVRFVSQETYETWFRGHPRPGDLIFVTKGSPGRVCLVPRPVGFCIAQDMVAVRADETKVYPKYLFAVLRSPTVQAEIENMHVGTLIPHFRKGDFDKLLLPIPDRITQQYIGDAYLTLSEKVELNQRMNETLEAMARAIFKSWFVDFDPVRARAGGGQPYGTDTETASLFPDSFQDSPLGKIPASWSVHALDEIAHFLNGLALQKYPPDGKEFLPVIKIAQLRKGNTEGADQAADIPPEYVVEDGDVLFSWSGSLEAVIWCGGRGALNQHLFKVTSKHYPKWFYYFWIREHLPDFQAIASGKATTMGHIQRHHLSEAKVLVPSLPLLQKMDDTIAPLLRRIEANSLESRNLATLRDALLPKLISGDVRLPVPDNDRVSPS